MRFAGAVAAVDRHEPRRDAGDGWTRDLSLWLPYAGAEAVADDETWEMLEFLTGDRWALDGRASTTATLESPSHQVDAVCLLSGGLDSLIGAIDLLAGDPDRRVLFTGVKDESTSSGRQQVLVDELRRRYPGRVEYVRANLPATKREDTTRARSLLFIAFGLLCASTAGSDVPLYIPENGMIGLNVPLIGSRSGSASTRTTHPHFMAVLTALLARLGISNRVVNPYRC